MNNNIPLPEKIRPKKLSQFVGQKHLVGKEGIIRKLLKSQKTERQFPSLILWGPPGSGKTTLARIISNELKREFFEFSAVNTSSKEIEKVITNIRNSPLTTHNSTPIIFLDEIHRFNKAQQDKLLPHIEKGDIVLIGATTENPSFEVIGPLLSRCRVLILEQLSEKDLGQIVERGLKELTRSHPELARVASDANSGSKKKSEVKLKIDPEAKSFLLSSSNGDARILLNTLEVASNLTSKHQLLTSDIEAALQRRYLSFDKQGEEFYNVISSFIKSMRAGQVDASLYYLARMVEAGQDPLYIARRMVVFASEDVASPTALVVANAVFQACQQIGYPECQENLAAGTVYLATAKKDRSSYDAYMEALADVKKFGNLPVPMNIRNAPTKLMKDLGYGKGYEKYTKESLLPEKLKDKKYYIKD